MMMEIQDSRGRKVSLLNDDLPRLSNLSKASSQHQNTLPPLQQHRAHSYFSGNHHSSGSERSTHSPPSLTPSLCRSDSSDSAALNSPSPPTPLSSGFEHLRQALPKRTKSQIDGLPGIDSLDTRPSSLSHHHQPSSRSSRHSLHHHPYSSSSSLHSPSKLSSTSSGAARSPMDFSQTPLGAGADFGFPSASTTLAGTPTSDALVAPIPNSALFAQQPLPHPLAFDASIPLAAAQQYHVPPVAPQATSQPPPQAQQQPPQQRPQKKNSYPCPLSTKYNCGEFFTTSGHAARHAKKHTGKKDAICPECGKGFTRKDNMEQHRRTHANGRNAHSHHHNSTSSSSSNSTAASTSSSTTSSNGKALPKHTDADESKARKKAQQQRKARPSSISTAAPTPIQIPQMTSASSQPSTATSAVPPAMDLLDPALREQAGFGFSPTSGGFENLYPFNANGGLALDNLSFQAPHAPMRTPSSSQGNASRMRLERRGSAETSAARPRNGPTSPSLAPKLDALALVADQVRRRDSDSSR